VFRHRNGKPPEEGHRGRRRRRPSDRGSASPAEDAGRGDRAGDRAADEQEQFIIDALHDLHDTVVREVMTPREEVVALFVPLTVDSVVQAVRESGHSCFPVCGDSVDDLIGVLFVNDLFRAGWHIGGGRDESGSNGEHGASADAAADGSADAAADGDADGERGVRSPGPIDISRRVRQPFLVPESHLVLDVLAQMRRQRRAFAVVVDEHGGVEGVLTVKDLLGALVGDLPDEFDPNDEPDVVRVDRNRWLVDGRTSIDEIHDHLDIELPEGEYVTVGGYLFHAFGHIPSEGESYHVGEWELRVTEMEKRRIAKVLVRRSVREASEPVADGADTGESSGSGGSAHSTVG
jgi:CBS domain containing-hemolysin-like protein